MFDILMWPFLFLDNDVMFLFAPHYSIIPALFLHYFKLFVHLSALLPRLLSWSESGGTFLVCLQCAPLCTQQPIYNIWKYKHTENTNTNTSRGTYLVCVHCSPLCTHYSRHRNIETFEFQKVLYIIAACTQSSALALSPLFNNIISNVNALQCDTN